MVWDGVGGCWGGGKRERSSVSICMVLAMAVCQTGGGSCALAAWGLGLFPCGALIISKRADRAVVEVEAPDSDETVGEGESRTKILDGVTGALVGVLLLILGDGFLVSACAYVACIP